MSKKIFGGIAAVIGLALTGVSTFMLFAKKTDVDEEPAEEVKVVEYEEVPTEEVNE